MLRDFYALLSANGYKIGKNYPHYVEFREFALEYGDFIGTNYLAVRSDLKNYISILS